MYALIKVSATSLSTDYSDSLRRFHELCEAERQRKAWQAFERMRRQREEMDRIFRRMQVPRVITPLPSTVHSESGVVLHPGPRQIPLNRGHVRQIVRSAPVKAAVKGVITVVTGGKVKL